MDSKIHPADLDGCVRPLSEEGRRVVRRYWEQVIREELVPVRPAPRAVPLPELERRRERREARRAVARITEAGRAQLRAAAGRASVVAA